MAADPHALDDYTRTTETYLGKSRDVYRQGTGPAVIVIAEVPGITPKVAAFARTVADRGMTVVLPHLFGAPGVIPSAGTLATTMGAVCISREFTLFATKKASPVTLWLRQLAAAEHQRCGGPGVGVVGMCLTGGFALAMMVDDTVVAPVLSQPSLPGPVTARHKADLGISDADLARVKERVSAGTCVLGLRFTGDPTSPPERFARLRQELGEGFIGVELDSSATNPHGHRKGAHSVLTEDFDDRPGTPTRAALDQVLDFFGERLLPEG
jgi:dienelactone hydrolase